MASEKKNSLIVQSTIDLAHALGLVVVAEGVEDRVVWEMLADQGCDFAQGFYLSRPMPADELEGWVHNRSPRAA